MSVKVDRSLWFLIYAPRGPTKQQITQFDLDIAVMLNEFQYSVTINVVVELELG